MNFSELIVEVHRVQDTILNDMVYKDTDEEDTLRFRKHLYCTKRWFSRVTHMNKLRFLMLLLDDVTSVWTLASLMKCIWNCRFKDPITSSNSPVPWSSYDQVPLAHGRADSGACLDDAMAADRAWFLTLDADRQMEVLLELLLVSGGPLMLRVLQRSQQIYDASRCEQLREISECVAVAPEVSPRSARSKKKKGDDATARSAKSTSRKKKADDATARSDRSRKKKEDEASDVGKDKDKIPKETQTPAEKQLEVSLSNWNAAITSLRSSIKMEEVEIVCGDEKKKLWKVQRPRIETLETLDQLQLIPDNIFKRILAYLPRSQLPELCKVNKYWASVIEDLKAEEAARLKISIELEKLRELKLAQPSSVTQLGRASPVWRSDSRLLVTPSQCGALMRDRAFERERVVAEREEARRRREKPKKLVASHKPTNKLKDIDEVLNIRGAMDKDMFHWCEAVIKLTEEDQYKNCKNDDSIEEVLGHLPSPLIEKHRNVAIPHLAHPYPAYKIVAHESPI